MDNIKQGESDNDNIAELTPQQQEWVDFGNAMREQEVVEKLREDQSEEIGIATIRAENLLDDVESGDIGTNVSIGSSMLARIRRVPKVKIEDFEDVRPSRKGEIRHDGEYVVGRKILFDQQNHAVDEETGERIYGHNDDKKEAKKFERALLQGIQNHHWLGESIDNPRFLTDTFESSDFDDYSRRIDAFTTLTLTQPNEGQDEIHQIVLGFDSTINTSRKVLKNKLTKSYNDDRVKLPFGCSEIKYYQTQDGPQADYRQTMRYVIGLSPKQTTELEHSARRANSANATDKWKIEYQSNLAVTRFKILTEIQAQNQLFEAMLPDDAYDSSDKKLQQATNDIESIDFLLSGALSESAKDIVKNGYFEQIFHDDAKKPYATTDKVINNIRIDYRRMQDIQHTMRILDRFEDVYDGASESLDHETESLINAGIHLDIVKSARKFFEDFKNTFSQEQPAPNEPIKAVDKYYDKHSGTIVKQLRKYLTETIEDRMKKKISPANLDPAFIHIMECTNELYNDALTGKLDDWRRVMAHTGGIDGVGVVV